MTYECPSAIPPATKYIGIRKATNPNIPDLQRADGSQGIVLGRGRTRTKELHLAVKAPVPG